LGISKFETKPGRKFMRPASQPIAGHCSMCLSSPPDQEAYNKKIMVQASWGKKARFYLQKKKKTE
jgi:hypothetical protein